MFTIENIAGIDCIFIPMKESSSFTIQIYCKNGSFYETVENNGISHFLEHMFFKGWEKYRTPKDVALAMDKYGFERNAYTSNEQVKYYIKSAPNYRESALDILSDMMVHPLLEEKEIEKEKGVIIQELKMREDDPDSYLDKKFCQWYFWENSYGRPIIGTEENILNFSRQKLLDYKNSIYTKDNMFIVVAGKFLDEQSLKKQIAILFNDLPATKKLTQQEYLWHIPEKHELVVPKECEQSYIIITGEGFNYYQSQKYPAKLLSLILWGLSSSRLYSKIRVDLGLCYYIGSMHGETRNFWNFQIYAGLDKEKLNFWITKIYEILDEISQGNITKEEFENAKTYLIGNFQMGIEGSYETASFYGNQFLYKDTIETLEERLQHFIDVKYEEVLDICPLLKRNNLYLGYTN